MPSQAEVARYLGVSIRQVRALRDRGLIPEPAEASLDDVRGAYLGHLREVAAGRKSADGSLDLAAERAKLARAQTERTELDLEERRGELVPVAEVERVFVAIASGISQRLQGVPAAAAPAAHAAETIAEAEAIIRQHVNDALTALADLGAQLGQGGTPNADA